MRLRTAAQVVVLALVVELFVRLRELYWRRWKKYDTNFH